MDIKDKVKQIISKQCDIDIKKFDGTEHESLKDRFGLDSLDILEISMAFERDFNIEIEDQDLINLSSIDAIEEYISKRV